MNDKFVFVSLIGNQIMGTIQPLMSFVDREGPMEIWLLPTKGNKGTLPEATRIEGFIHECDLGDAVIETVAYELTDKDSAPALVTTIAKNSADEGKRVCFNLDGGLNYMVHACVIALEPFKPLLIQSTRTRSVIYDSSNCTWYETPLPAALPVEKIMELQEVPYNVLETNPDVCVKQPFEEYARKNKIKFPEKYLRNVKIDDIVFDVVWNSGNNRLSFFKDWRLWIENSQERLKRERGFAGWGTNRKRCGDLYDRSFYILVGDNKSIQRLKDDSGGKITPIDVYGNYSTAGGKTRDAPEELSRLFTEKIPLKEGQINFDSRIPLQKSLRNNTLIVCLGANLLSTLLAICSHKPEHLLLCYNSMGNNMIDTYARNLKRLAPDLGLKSVTTVPYDLEGMFTDELLPGQAESKARVVLNSSPGTKGQGTMLTLWAAKHGYEVYSLDSAKRACRPLHGNRELIPMDICDPALILRIMGKKLMSPGKNEDDLREDFDWLDALLEFMRRAAAAEVDFGGGIKKGRVRVGQDSFDGHAWSLVETGKGRYGEYGKWRLQLDGMTYWINESKSTWYEKIAARALLAAGASHIRLNPKLQWNEKNESALRERHNNPAHRVEFDVVGSFYGDLVLISVKSYELNNNEDTDSGHWKFNDVVREVRDISANLERFALSMVSDMGSSKQTQDTKVAIVGWRELCQPDKLNKAIRELHRNQTSTGDSV